LVSAGSQAGAGGANARTFASAVTVSGAGARGLCCPSASQQTGAHQGERSTRTSVLPWRPHWRRPGWSAPSFDAWDLIAAGNQSEGQPIAICGGLLGVASCRSGRYCGNVGQSDAAVPLARPVANVVPSAARGRNLTRWWRPARFVVIGGVCGAMQLALLWALTESTGLGATSNVIAFLISGAANFILNARFTWNERRAQSGSAALRQAVAFSALILVATGLNQAVYVAVLRVAPYLIAGAIGIIATTAVKYLATDRWVFKRASTVPSSVAG